MPRNITILIVLALTLIACGAETLPAPRPPRPSPSPAPTSILNGEYTATPVATTTPRPSATAPAPVNPKDIRHYGESWYSDDNPVEPGRVYYQATASETRIRMFVEADREQVIRDNHHSGLGPPLAILSFYCNKKNEAYVGISSTMLARAAFDEGYLRVRIYTPELNRRSARISGEWPRGYDFPIYGEHHPEAVQLLSRSPDLANLLPTTQELTFELGNDTFGGGGPFIFDATRLRESPAWTNITECEE